MSVIRTCDYCGRNIEEDELFVQIDSIGRVPDSSVSFGWENERTYFGHFHSDPRDCGGERSCYGRVSDAVWLTMECGPTLETIQTASAQKIGQLRRKHRKPD